jgi:DNA polymerase-3 subunit delta'
VVVSFSDFPEQSNVSELLQRSLSRGRLAHGYLFSGDDLGALESMALTLAKTLNCSGNSGESDSGIRTDSCDVCLSCRKIKGRIHPDIHWVRPESKLRIITIGQIREVMRTIYLKPTEAKFKVTVIVAADRLNVQAANAFLKTLEEPPDGSTIILLSTEPDRILDTILSRCLRLACAGPATLRLVEGDAKWIGEFSQLVAQKAGSVMARYNILGSLLKYLACEKQSIKDALTEVSPLQRYDDLDPKLKEKWETELTAAIEAEYRRRRAELLLGLQWWLRDVWLLASRVGQAMLNFPEFEEGASKVAARISEEDAVENLRLIEKTQKLLHTNVQEALALEVGLLQLRL